MSRHLPLVGTLLRKDLRLFWPFAALIAGLLAVWQIPPLIDRIGPVAGIVQLGLQFGMIALILVVIYEDAVVSLKHDWLTRPIPGTVLLLEKALFVLLALILPSIVGAVIYNLYQGHSIPESLLAGLSKGAGGDMLLAIPIVMAFAAVTTSIRQGIVVFLTVIVGLALLSVLARSVYGDGPPPTVTGSSWVLLRSVQCLLALTAVTVLCVQYRYRHTSASRVIAALAVVLAFAAVMILNWPRVFALQRWLTSDAAADSAVQVALAEECFPARRLGGGAVTGPAEAITPDLYLEDARQEAGADAIAFRTRLEKRAVPAGHRLVVDMVGIRYRGAPGEPVHPAPSMRVFMQRMIADSGRDSADHYWLLTADDNQRLAATAGVQTQLHYSMSLLAPRATVEFVADGSRAYYPGIGFCGATTDTVTGVVAVDCFKPGVQPAQLVGYLIGSSPDSGVASGRADYTPVLFDFWGGMRHRIQLQGRAGPAPRVRLTTFEARTHFDRHFIVPGVLGGPVSACPAQ